MNECLTQIFAQELLALIKHINLLALQVILRDFAQRNMGL